MKKYFFVLLFILGSLVLERPGMAEAARWEILLPATSGVNDDLRVELRLNTEGEKLNAFEGTIVFPVSSLELVNISDAGSVINFWVEKPRTTTDGRVVFSGITPGGLVVDDGLLLTLQFRALREGAAVFRWEMARSLRHDGRGEAVVTLTRPASVTIATKSDRDLSQAITDTYPPEFFVPSLVQDQALFNGKWAVIFSTTDKQSGLNRYEVKESPFRWWSWFSPWRLADSPLELSDQSRQSFIWIKAVDNADHARVVSLPPLKTVSWYQNLEIWSMIGIGLILIFMLCLLFKRKFSCLILGVILVIVIPKNSEAASLFISPSTGTHLVGEVFPVSINVASVEQAMNAASGTLSFSADKLEVVSISKTGSIVSLWVEDPRFDNSLGEINFEGIVLNPGFAGPTGTVLVVNFRAKTPGAVDLRFRSGSVLANDGQGTNILTGLASATFNLLVNAVVPPVLVELAPDIGPLPAAPKINSATHPDPDSWYRETEARFAWEVPAGVTAVRLLIGRLPQASPTVHYSPPITNKTISQLEDGVWYFHAQYRNAAGWGPVTHRRLRIDSTPPSDLTIKPEDESTARLPIARLAFQAADNQNGSGLDRLEVFLDNDLSRPQVLTLTSEETVFETPPLTDGAHTVLARVYDRAGNYLERSLDFMIDALDPPQLTDYPLELTTNDPLLVQGLSEPRALITLWWKRANDSPNHREITSDDAGRFAFVVREDLPAGVYELWATARLPNGIESGPAAPITFRVLAPRWLRWGTEVTAWLAVFVPLFSLLVLLVLISVFAWWRIKRWRRRVKQETDEVETTVRQAFNLLREGLARRIDLLEQTKTERRLTVAEQALLRQFKQELDLAEQMINREVVDIQRSVE